MSRIFIYRTVIDIVLGSYENSRIMTEDLDSSSVTGLDVGHSC